LFLHDLQEAFQALRRDLSRAWLSRHGQEHEVGLANRWRQVVRKSVRLGRKQAVGRIIVAVHQQRLSASWRPIRPRKLAKRNREWPYRNDRWLYLVALDLLPELSQCVRRVVKLQ